MKICKMVRNYDISQFTILFMPKSMTYKYHLRSGFRIESKKMKSIIKSGVISIQLSI